MSKITMSDVAKRAGVSRKAASITFNNTPTTMVSQATRDKILKAARELNYRPNYFATSLKKGKTNLVGVSISGRASIYFLDPYPARIYSGIGRVLTNNNYKMLFHLLSSTHYDRDQSHDLVEARVVDGMIYILGSSHVDVFRKTTLPYLNKQGTPFVVIHSLKDPLDCPNIGLDCVQAGVLAAEHLLDHGYHTIGCVRRSSEFLHTENMYQGYIQAMQAHGREVDESFIYTCPAPRREEAYEWADRLLKEKKPLPEALFITGDHLAEGIVKRFREAGIRIPGDLAIVGFGNAADPYHFPITTIYQPSEEKGEQAAKMLLDLIDKPGNERKPFYCFEPKLIIRETSLKTRTA